VTSTSTSHLPPRTFLNHCASLSAVLRARAHTHTHTHTHTTVGKGLETLARELDISVAEVESWITAFSAAFPAVGRKVSALRRGGGGRADGGGEGGGTGRERELRSISGRLCLDSRSVSSLLLCACFPGPLLPVPACSHSVPFATLHTLPLPMPSDAETLTEMRAPTKHQTCSLAGGGWERVRMLVQASLHDIKKAVYLCACKVLAAVAARAGRGGGGCGENVGDARCRKAVDHSLAWGQDPVTGGRMGCGWGPEVMDDEGGGGDAGESRCVLVTDQGVLLQVGEERVAEVMAELRSAVAAVEWWPEDGGDRNGAQEDLTCGSSTSVVGDAMVNFLCGYRCGALGR
jgi:hypothetical protein